MLSINKAKQLLNTGRKKEVLLNDKDVEQVLKFLEVFARASVEQFNQSKDQ